MKIPHASRVIEAVLAIRPGVIIRRATLYMSPELVVSAYRDLKYDRRGDSFTCTVRAGTPDFTQQEFIVAHQKAGKVFPVKKIQLEFYRNAPHR